jgi:hypothetical protein
MSTTVPHIESLPLAGGAAPSTSAKPGGTYLRRYGVRAHRKSHARVAAALLVLAALLFAKVWESTEANALSMERDRLRREVRTLENRIRLSTELREQAALHTGTDSKTLEARGFVAPSPSHIVDVDLSRAVPRAEVRR